MKNFTTTNFYFLLNNFCKINESVLQLWADVLRSVPDSRLMLLADLGTHRQRTIDFLAEQGIRSDRISFSSLLPRAEYLKLYHQIDIALDTVPYNGHTTSLDCFWMGVPVVTLVGQTVVGRAGLSQLTNMSLTELIAHEPEGYVQIARNLAADIPRLIHLRQTLRDRFKASPLMNGSRFAQNLEAAYREIWQRWCAADADVIS